MRPGARYLPTLVLGRSRGDCAERKAPGPALIAATPGPALAAAGAPHVTLLRSTPRPTYRIYSEEAFLAAEDWRGETAPELALHDRADPHRKPWRWRRVAVLAALTSVVAAVVGVVALNATRSRSPSDRRLAGGTAAPRRTPPEIVAQRPSRPRETRPGKPSRRASVPVGRVTKRDRRSRGRAPFGAHPHLPPPPAPPAEDASSPTTAANTTATTATPTTAAASTPVVATSGTPTTATASTPVAVAPGTPTTATASTPVAARAATAATPASGAGSEFGFER